jgi:hypothetical protein
VRFKRLLFEVRASRSISLRNHKLLRIAVNPEINAALFTKSTWKGKSAYRTLTGNLNIGPVAAQHQWNLNSSETHLPHSLENACSMWRDVGRFPMQRSRQYLGKLYGLFASNPTGRHSKVVS